jgi:hypothetical protein
MCILLQLHITQCEVGMYILSSCGGDDAVLIEVILQVGCVSSLPQGMGL